MNVENILKVADAIEQHSIPDLGFNMHNWMTEATENVPDRSGHSCGTVACIAGWAYAVATGGPVVPGNRGGHIMIEAREFLGLGYTKSIQLFEPNDEPEIWADITQSAAVSVLRHFAATGEVDWDRAIAAQPVQP